MNVIAVRKVFKDFKQCYTCKMEFDGYYNLMNHRKIVHPSKKKCRNFPANCTFGNDCWYVHTEPMEVDEYPTEFKEANTWNFKCNLCDEEILERRDFMAHKKTKHGDTVLPCQNFLLGKCSRSEESCWFKHDEINPERKNSDNQVFQKVPQSSLPPDQLSVMVKMLNRLCSKVENMEQKFRDLMD